MSKYALDRVEVGRYSNPEDVGYTGWIGTRDWIAFEGVDGSLHVFNGRDPETGGVLEDAEGAVIQPA